MKHKTAVIGRLCLCCALMLLAACRTSKQVTEQPLPDKGALEGWTERVCAESLKTGTVTSKLSLDLNMGGKTLSVGGSCSLKRGELIQLSLVALGIMEVGRIEFTPQYVLMINRMEKQYMKVSYNEVPYLQQAGIDFQALQSLFWADLYSGVPGQDWAARDFVARAQEGDILLSGNGRGMLDWQYVVDAQTGLVRQSTIALNGSSDKAMDWNYLRYTTLADKNFPERMHLKINGTGKSVTVGITLNNLKWNAKQVTPSEVPGGRYKEVDANELIKKLLK